MENVTEIINPPMPPQQSQLNWMQIEAKAAEISKEHDFDPRKQTVRELAHAVGGPDCIEVVSLDQMENLDSGSLEVFGHRSFKIFLSPITSTVRDNFTIAHELGHYFLHSGNPHGSQPIIVGRSGDNNVVEQQANRFAAALLMPKELFTQAFTDTQGNVFALAGLFNVSRPSVQVRLQSLRLTT